MAGLDTHYSKQLHLLFVEHSPLTVVLPREQDRPWFVILAISVCMHLVITPRTVTGYSSAILEYAFLVTTLTLKLGHVTAAHGTFSWNYSKTKLERVIKGAVSRFSSMILRSSKTYLGRRKSNNNGFILENSS